MSNAWTLSAEEDFGTITLGEYRAAEAAGVLHPERPAPARPSGVDALREAIYPRGMDVAWMRDANCVGLPTEAFYVYRGQGGYDGVAKVCAECSVRAECLEYALATQGAGTRMVDFGYWGGMTVNERVEIKRRRRRRAA